MARTGLFGSLYHLIFGDGDNGAGDLGTSWNLGFLCLVRGDGCAGGVDLLRCAVPARHAVDVETCCRRVKAGYLPGFFTSRHDADQCADIWFGYDVIVSKPIGVEHLTPPETKTGISKTHI